MLTENRIPLSYDKSWSPLPRNEPFLENPTLEERIFALCQRHGIEGVHLIKTSQIRVSQRVRLLAQNIGDHFEHFSIILLQ